MIPVKSSAFEANAKRWIISIFFLVEFLHGNKLGIGVFKELCRKQCGKIDRVKEATNLENDLKMM